MGYRKTLIVLSIIILIVGVIKFNDLNAKEYSIKDVKEGEFKGNLTNETFVFVKLPDETEIITNKKTGISMIRQPLGIIIWFFDSYGASVRLRDGSIDVNRNWMSFFLNEDKTISEAYLLNKAKIIENGRTLVLPDETKVYLELENKIIIRLKSRIVIVKDDKDGVIVIKLYDGYLVKYGNKDWSKYPILQGQSDPLLNKYPFIYS